MLCRVLFVCAVASSVYAQLETATVPEPLRDVGIDQKLNEQLPLDLVFADEAGVKRPLHDYFRGRPVVLSLVYYECPMLCTMELNGLLRVIRVVPLDAGRDFDILTISFDPKEGAQLAAAKKDEYVRRYRRPTGEQGWHFLTGDEENIRKLTNAVGFRYRFDAVSGQWAHASGIMILTPEGRLSRYFYGVEYAGRDLRLGLVEASRGKISSPVDQVLLYCFHYDPKTGKYSLAVLKMMRIAGAATVLALGVFWFSMYRSSRKKRPAAA
jgi:protein SCO1/2